MQVKISNMANKVFIDANVLLDFSLKREHYSVSKEIVEMCIKGDIKLYTTPAIIHILAYWLTKSYGVVKTKEIVLSLLDYVHIIDANHEVTIKAINSQIDDIEDALQYFTAINHRVNFFLTRDQQFIKQANLELPVFTPEKFIKEVYMN